MIRRKATPLCVNLFLFLVWVSGLALGADTLANAESPKIKIGAILPLSGEASGIGEGAKNAMLLALDELPSTTKQKMEILFEDDGMLPKNTVTAFNKLVGVNKVDVVVNLSSGTANAISPLAEKAKVPFIAVASDPRVVANKKYVVNFWVTPEEESRALLAELEKRSLRKIVSIATIHDGPAAAKKAFYGLSKGKIELMLDEEYPPDIKDFKPFLAKLRKHKEAQGIMIILMPGQLGIFAKQARQMGVALPLFGWEIFEDSQEVKSSEGALLGSWYVNASDPSGAFLKEYQKRHPDSSLFGVANSYDIIHLVAKAVEQASAKATKESINNFLHTVKDFTGALGTYSASGDNRFTLPATIKVITATGFEPLYK